VRQVDSKACRMSHCYAASKTAQSSLNIRTRNKMIFHHEFRNFLVLQRTFSAFSPQPLQFFHIFHLGLSPIPFSPGVPFSAPLCPASRRNPGRDDVAFLSVTPCWEHVARNGNVWYSAHIAGVNFLAESAPGRNLHLEFQNPSGMTHPYRSPMHEGGGDPLPHLL